MTTKTLPKYIQPLRLAEQRASLHGQALLRDFSRLHDVLSDTTGEVSVHLQFGQDNEGVAYITGVLDTVLQLECQRCLKPLPYSLHVEVSLSPVFNEVTSKNLPERYEPLLLDEDQVTLIDMIEDELLLSLPLVAKHEAGCVARGQKTEAEE